MEDQAKKPSGPIGSDADPGNVLFDIWLLSRATTALLDKVVQASGLDSDEFAVYSVLSAGDGLTPSELARWMSAPATTVSSYVKRFEARGHVRRAPNPTDGRSYRLQLTTKGRRVHLAAGKLFAPVLDEVNREGGVGLDDARHLFHDLHRIVAALGTTSQ